MLHLDSSARSLGSVSRVLGEELLLAWSAREPGLVVTYRDLNAEPLGFVTDSWVAAAFSPSQTHDRGRQFALSRSEQLIGELEAADVLLVGAPMYNFGIPAALKAWVDQIVRLGRTFGYNGPEPVGLVHGKRAVVLATSGGDALRYEQLGLDFRTSYLRAILAFIGITQLDVVAVVDTVSDVDLSRARAQVDGLVTDLSGDRGAAPVVVPTARAGEPGRRSPTP